MLRFRCALGLVALLLTVGCVRRVEGHHVFGPHPLPSLDPAPDQSFARLEVPMDADEALRGWVIRHPEARANLLFFYGTGEKVSRAHWRLFPWAQRFKLNIINVDYRGFGFSDGRPSLETFRPDALRIFDGTAQLRAGLPTLVMGFSFGTVAAIHVGAHRDVAGVALMAPISTPEEVLPALQHRVPWYARPFVTLEADPSLQRLEPPLAEMGRVKVPLLVLHGEQDPLVPVTCGLHVLEAAGSRDKALCVVPRAAHNDVYLWHEPAESAFRAWLDRALTPPR